MKSAWLCSSSALSWMYCPMSLSRTAERLRVGRVPAAARNLAVLHAAELVVLLPQIRFEKLGRRQELENCHVTLGEAAMRVTRTGRGCWWIGQQATSADCSGSERSSLDHEGTTVHQMPRLFARFHDSPLPAMSKKPRKSDGAGVEYEWTKRSKLSDNSI